MRRRTSLSLAIPAAACLLIAAFVFPFVIATGPAELTWLYVGAVCLPIGFIAPEIGAFITTLSIATYAAAYPLLADFSGRLTAEGRLQAHMPPNIDPAALPFRRAMRVTGLHR